MKLNEKEITIPPYAIETINDNIVLYNEAAKKIAVVNQTGAFIWKEIAYMYQKGCDLKTEDIVNKIFKVYSISDIDFQDVYDDVSRTISYFFEASLLEYSSGVEIPRA